MLMFLYYSQRPNKDVEIQVIVEESEERLSEEQMRDLIDIINKTLPPLPSEEEEEEGVDDMSSWLVNLCE